MSKKQSPSGIAWGKASSELQDKVKFVLQQAQNNRYSVSRVYAAYNAVFELSEAPQTCSSCLTSRVSKLRKWWGENVPKEQSNEATYKEIAAHLTTGEGQEAASYEGVVAKHKLAFDDEAGEAELLTKILADGNEFALSENERALVEARAGELAAAAHASDLEGRVKAKLADLGVTDESPVEDVLEAYELLAGTEGNPEDEAAAFAAQVEVLKRQQAETATLPTAAGVKRFDMGEGVLGMDFTPSTDDATKGTILNADGSKPSAGTYEAADGSKIVVQVGGKARIETK